VIPHELSGRVVENENEKLKIDLGFIPQPGKLSKIKPD